MIEPVRQSPVRHAAARGSAKAAAGAEPQADDAIDAEREAFDFRLAERAELLRESNALRDMMLAQLKADDEALKKYIAMI
jgi:hypothetical protein